MLKRETVYQWLLAISLHFVLFNVARELKSKKAVLTDDFLKYNDNTEEGPANRIVLVVIGGLRWDVLFSNEWGWQIPSWILERGTVVPVYTEFPNSNYQGLATMLSGVPGIESKTAYNLIRSSETHYVGPPSVKEALIGIKDYLCYPEVWENLTANLNETKGDEWGLKTLYHHLTATTINDRNKTLFLLYLDGVAISSHLDGVYSRRTHKEMSYIFDDLKQIYLGTEKFFHDSKTAYIVTSDYSFIEENDQVGNSVNDSIVPLLSWGAGLASANERAEDSSRIHRKDVTRQEDLAPLMSYLMGTAIPPNNFGDAPLVVISKIEDKATMIFLNAVELCKLFLSFKEAFGFGLSYLFSPLDKYIFESAISDIRKLLFKKEYYLSISRSQDLIELALEGINYYRDYEANILFIFVIISLISWTAVTSGWTLEKVKITPIIQREMVSERQDGNERSTVKNLGIFRRFLTPSFIIHIISFLIFCSAIAILISVSAPLIVSLAAILAIIMTWLAARSTLDWIRMYKSLSVPDLRMEKGKPLMHIVYFLIFTCCLSYPIVIQAMFSFAIVFSALSDLRNSKGSHLAYWMVSSLSYLILLHFKFLTPYLPALIIAAILWIAIVGIFMRFLKVRYFDWPIFVLAFFSIGLISVHSQYSPQITQKNIIVRWTTMISILFVPLLGSSSLPVRLLQLCLCLLIFIFLVSLSFEPISFLFISSHLFSWLLLEGYPDTFHFLSSPVEFPGKSDTIIWSDIRRCFYFLAYILTSFLVTGNSNNIYEWSNGWPSLFGFSSGIEVFFLVFLKSFPIVLLDSAILTLLEKNNHFGYQTILINLSSIASLFNFILFSDSSLTLYNQLLFFFYLLSKPLAYLFITPSLISLLVGRITSGRSEKGLGIREPPIAETSL